jgi:DNA-binding winged helix-turn-helix (wHTH) protein
MFFWIKDFPVNSEDVLLSPTVTFVPEKSCLTTSEYGDVHLTPNERRLLELVISGKCKKETIFDEIWHSQGMIVSESSYHQLIKMLRRKLQHAGLPGSTIKTIPRYGIVLTPCEPLASKDESPAPEDGDAVSCDGNNLPDARASRSVMAAVKAIRHRGLSLVVLCGLLAMIPLLLVLLLMDKPQAFPEQLEINGVVFHLPSVHYIDRDALVRKRQSLPANISNVYIASNGPKVFFAQCVGELSKGGSCSYEYSSSY